MVSDLVEKKTAEVLIPPTIAKAIIKIQKTLDPMVKSAENEAFNSNYVPLEDVVTKALQMLTEEGVGVTQSPVTDDQGHAALETMLFTGSGAAFKRTTKLAMREVSPQNHGSAITYTRRYALMAMLGLTGKGEDDDGNKATGVLAPVRQEQLDAIRVLLSLIPWPKEMIDKTVRAIRTRDAADLAIAKYERVTAQIKRDQEAITNAEKGSTTIPVADAEDVVDESTPHGTIQARITALKLASKAMENKFVFSITGRPFLHRVKEESDLKMLSTALTSLENGTRNLPAEYYAPTDEPRIVDEDVA